MKRPAHNVNSTRVLMSEAVRTTLRRRAVSEDQTDHLNRNGDIFAATRYNKSRQLFQGKQIVVNSNDYSIQKRQSAFPDFPDCDSSVTCHFLAQTF